MPTKVAFMQTSAAMYDEAVVAHVGGQSLLDSMTKVPKAKGKAKARLHSGQ